MGHVAVTPLFAARLRRSRLGVEGGAVGTSRATAVWTLDGALARNAAYDGRPGHPRLMTASAAAFDEEGA